MFDTTGSPLKKGFDHFFGYNCQRHAHKYFPTYLYSDDKKIEITGKQYGPDIIAEDTYKWIRENADKPFFLYFATPLTHNLGIDTVGEYAKEKWNYPDKVHAAMTTRVDAHIGQLLDLLRELKLDEKTIVFVAAGDNGPDTDPQSERCKLFGTATDQNLRGFKRSMYEGGLRQGGIVRWPGKVPADKTIDEPWAFWDFLPTAADLAGVKLPGSLKIDGLSVLPALLGGEMPKRPYFYWELNEPHFKQAIRFGDWKALRDSPGAPLELYDLKSDPSESKNLAAAHPDLVAKAEALMKQARTDDPNWPVNGPNIKKRQLKSPAASEG